MMIEIETRSGTPIFRQVLDQIRRQILSGQLREGEQLTSVRELSGKLGVNPMTVSKAYSILEMEGLICRKRGLGLFVSALEEKRSKDSKQAILSELIRKLVLTAVQLGLSEKDVSSKLHDDFQTFSTKKEK